MKKNKNKTKQKVILLCGGPSSEYEVSLSSAFSVLTKALLDNGKYDTRVVVIRKNYKWSEFFGTPAELKAGKFNENNIKKFNLKLALKQNPIFLIIMHGEYGEDGKLQKKLEKFGACFTGSDSTASALAMNKLYASAKYCVSGLLVPDFLYFTKKQFSKDEREIINNIKFKIKIPCVVKPIDRGSSVGISIVKNPGQLRLAIKKAFKCSQKIIIQQFIAGREITCGILDDGLGQKIEVLAPTEIFPKSATFFDYKSKYQEGGACEITPPKKLSKTKIKEIQQVAKKAHQLLGCSGMSRTDMILDKNGKIWTIETNTIPGLTQTSLLPQGALAKKISFKELIERIIQSGLLRCSKR